MRRIGPLSLGVLSVLALPAATGFAASQDNNVEWDGVHSDTTAQFVTPMNFKAGESIKIRLRVRAGDLTAATIRLWFSGPNYERRLSLVKEAGGARFDTWSASVTVPTGSTAVYYRFELTDGTDTDYFDAGAPADAWTIRGMSDEFRGDDYNFVLVPGFSTPEWSQRAVFYQVFPDRFYDGSSSNNNVFPDDCFWYLDYAPASPQAAACAGYTVPSTPSGYTKLCEVHDLWEETPNGGPCDFFGGDLDGVRSKLSYIKGLNANAVYLNPIFRSPSNHKYDTMDYNEVDPRFGGNQSLSGLVGDARAQGIKVIADGVFNHTSDLGLHYNGWGNYALTNGTATGYDYYSSSCGAWEDGFAKKCSSSYSDWFKLYTGKDDWDVDRDGDKQEPYAHTCGWAGLGFMPEIDYKSPADSNSEPRVWLYGGASAADPTSAKQSVAGQWLKGGGKVVNGLDGWRLDVPDNAGYFSNTDPSSCAKVQNDVSIWQGFRKAVKAVDGDGLVIGEIWKDATTNGGVNWATTHTYDGVMNYHYFAMPVSCLITGQGVHSDPNECVDDYAPMKSGSATAIDALDAHLAKQRRLYPAAFYFSSQNLLSSHDTSRFASRASGDLKKLQEAVFFQATLPGAPMVYYGDEVGVLGNNNELGRATFPWSVFSNESSAQVGLYNLTKGLFCVRNRFPALQTGSFVTLWTHNTEKTYGFGRFDATDRIAVAINNDGATHTVALAVERLDIADGTTLVDVVSGSSYQVASGKVSVTVQARSGAILVAADRADAGRQCFLPNSAPTADAGPDQTITEGEAVELDGAGSSDPEDDTLTFEWTNEGGELLGDTPVVVVTGLAEGTHTFFLTVNDGELEDTDEVVVTVKAGSSDGGGCGGRVGFPGAKFGLLLPVGLSGLFLRRRR